MLVQYIIVIIPLRIGFDITEPVGTFLWCALRARAVISGNLRAPPSAMLQQRSRLINCMGTNAILPPTNAILPAGGSTS